MTTLDALEPALVWQLFAGLSSFPRPSKHEARVRDWIIALAHERGFTTAVDPAGNLRVDVPASPGFEDAQLLVIQGHLDMVTEANPDSTHDFFNDPITLIVDREPGGRQIVRADATTLGADNGIGVSLALAAALDPQTIHGPFELLLTVDEEMGLTGANALSPDFFSARRMINLDSEDDGALYIGCAGGMDTSWRFDLPTSPLDPDLAMARVVVGGLRGGHSGGDIHENRGNALKALTRVLRAAPSLRIVSIDGGSKRNAIPRHANALVAAPPAAIAALTQAASRVRDAVAAESYEPDADVHLVTEDLNADAALSIDDTARLLAALCAAPSGVTVMHPRVEGLVQTSNNLSTATTTSAAADRLSIEIGLLSRSSTTSLLYALTDQLLALGQLSGAAVEQYGEYPGWNPDPDSPLLATCVQVHQALFDKPPRILAIHAGLECGVIGDRVGGLEAISFGPDIRGAHSPSERVYVDSVQRCWTYLRAVLDTLARAPR